MNTLLPRSARRLVTSVAATAAVAGSLFLFPPTSAQADTDTDADPDPGTSANATAAAVALPPAHANFDYQIGGAYTPPTGVKVVSRDHTAAPAQGIYNICYVNAFQTQRGAEKEWRDDLLLRRDDGTVVYDGFWKEALLDLRTPEKRSAVAEKVNGWIDECANKGFQAVEPDNYDSFTRSDDLLTDADAKAYITLLSEHTHKRGLAIAQKNTSELSEDRATTGLDFAIAEECGQNNECGDYTKAFGNHVIAIEYTSKGLSTACRKWGDSLSVVRRDLDVVPVGTKGYVRQTC
ncbi:endo alpha-1,4 polygalactosaminidase [Streptomyces sp. SID3343]|uniref:endo alpha-1,4 polygalactosaminidase n=1 Tax=Streptomyces sp. SID3343 TaxID=2690260 RepID=UPI00136A4763|nr:endo alpha-1,4 polygalactosaminidase [Streptomyces sp. SID3343]MYV96896.1 hypothetical protein [Streptomyces sp. SID3343]